MIGEFEKIVEEKGVWIEPCKHRFTAFNTDVSFSFVIMTIAMASREFEIGGGVKIGFSSLLVCMMLGTVFCNFSEYSVDIMNRSSKWTAPLYALFFVLSGAELDLGVFRYPAIILIGIVYIIGRCLGKYIGAWISSS